MKQLGWHFLNADRRLAYPPHALVAPGMVLERDPGQLALCKYGLHWSKKALDALWYAPGSIVCRVECSGRTIEEDDKCVSSVRKVLWMADAMDTLRAFARWCALQIIDKWDAPDVVRTYLETGDESLRAAARAAAYAAAYVAADATAYAAAADAAAYAAARTATYAAYATNAANAAYAAAYAADAAAYAADAAATAACDRRNEILTEMLEALQGVSS